MKFKNNGIALVQVLLMVAIMMLIALQFSFTSRDQVSVSSDFKDRLQAELKLKTLQSEVLFNFFKHDPYDLSDATVGGYKWNLRGRPFSLGQGTEVSIQAASGLLSLSMAPEKYLFDVLRYEGVSTEKAEKIVDSIQDWVDTNNSTRTFGAESGYYASKGIPSARNGSFQHVSELAFINGVGHELAEKLEGVFTPYSSASFNPGLAPPNVVKAIFPQGISDQIIAAQQQSNFSEKVWRGIVGSREFDFVDIHPRSIFKVTLRATHNEVRLIKNFDILVQTQRQKDPIVFLSQY